MGTVYLLDVNVLAALFLPRHQMYERANQWFMSLDDASWATCPFTQSAFVRLACNPAVMASPLTPPRAVGLLAENLKREGHIFWPMDVMFTDAVAPFSSRINGHRQVTDAYLVGLTMRNKGKLATMDRAISALLSSEEAARFVTEV